MSEITAALAVAGYALAAIALIGLLVVVALNWRGGAVARAIVAAALVGAAWCMTVAYEMHLAPGGATRAGTVFGTELLRNSAWLIVLSLVLKRSGLHRSAARWVNIIVASSTLLMAAALGVFLLPEFAATLRADAMANGIRLYVLGVLVATAVTVLVLIEQLFRSAGAEQRWAVKYFCLGLGGIYAFDFYMYSEALLFQAIDINVWTARGYVNALMVPLIGLSFARNPEWSVSVHVSRKLAFHTVTLLGAGVYLVAMSLAGYYIRVFGGDWGLVGQIVFLFSAIVLLFALLFSGEARARVKVFFNKHLATSKYDYREEWLRMTDALSRTPLDHTLRDRALQALEDVVESTGGALFQRSGESFRLVTMTNLALAGASELRADDAVVRFLRERRWVINLDEFARTPQVYGTLELPAWLKSDARTWLVVPLLQHDELLGFVVLARGRAPMATNWEVRDMLLMTGRQVAGYLALLEANEALIEARQFEAFNRLSAYVVHDLKNLVAQLSLVVSNAARHRANPAFMDDAIRTVSNAVDKMSKLLAQLRKGRLDAGEVRRVNLNTLVAEAVSHRANRDPKPEFSAKESENVVLANPERLTAVVEHLIQNAQEATPADGRIAVEIVRRDHEVHVAVADTGCGMDAAFVRERLFRPFSTTKGNAGMGIGVYESREFLRANGGRLDVTSEPGRGTTFTMILPLYRAPIAEQHTPVGKAANGEIRPENAVNS